MLDWSKILFDGSLITLLSTIYLLVAGSLNPRLFLNKGDLPEDILAVVPPKTPREKKLSLLAAIPLLTFIFILPAWSAVSFKAQAGGSVSFFTLFLHVLIIVMMFNLFDLVVIDWFIINTLTPRFIVYPGTEGFAGYKDRMFHLRAHTRALPGVLVGVLIITAIAWML
jgi:hypothetical protein